MKRHLFTNKQLIEAKRGRSHVDAAKTLGVSHSIYRKWLKNIGEYTPRKCGSKPGISNAFSLKSEIEAKRNAGLTWQQIGDALGVSKQRAFQLWNTCNGKCYICGRKSGKYVKCERHRKPRKTTRRDP